MSEPKTAAVLYVANFVTAFSDAEEAYAKTPDAIAAHLSRSNELHRRGLLLMAGAFLDEAGEPLQTMAVFSSREDAEAFALGDPFVQRGLVTSWRIRKWASILD